MAEHFAGRVIRMPLGGHTCRSKEPLLDRTLASIDGVAAYFIDCDEGVLTAYVDDITADERHIVRALVASGMYPVAGFEPANTREDDQRAC